MSFTLCINHLYLNCHYHLYFYPAFITSGIVFILIIGIIIIVIIIIISTIIIMKINLVFSISELLKL